MVSAIIALAVFGSVAALWMSARGAAEVASHYGRKACEEHGVQWLDHTVMLERFRFKRDTNGWIRPLRRYRFDFSTDGNNRLKGHLELLGTHMQWLNLPVPPPPTRATWEASIKLSGPTSSDSP